MKYEITIRELTPYTDEELKEFNNRNRNSFDIMEKRYSNQPFKEVRVLSAEVSKEEFEAVKKAIIGVI